MASEKNPSIYYDRSTIGSSEELDEYGVWVKSEPQDLSPVNADIREAAATEEYFAPELTGDLPDFTDIEPEPQQAGVSADMTELADFNITSAGGPGVSEDLNWFNDGPSVDEAAEDNVPELAEADAGEEEPVPVIEDMDAFGNDRLSDIPIDDFLLEPEAEEDISGLLSEDEESEDSGELSTRLLMKIAAELSSIKDELSSLKKELHQIRGGAEEQDSGGFFDEEEDEKIALTGDELDDILHTADFTEEAGTEEENPDGTGSFPDFAGQVSEPGVEADGEDLLVLPSENPEVSLELEQLRENGVEPMTPAPEDTSFLEGDPAAADLSFSDLPEEDSFDISSFDNSSFDSSFNFDDAVIEEPDLNGELHENPIEEPSLENLSIDLDMEIPSTDDEAAELSDNGVIEEIELSLDDSVELSGGVSPDDELLDASAGISLDDLIDIPAAGETETAGDGSDDDTYNKVIPEGFRENLPEDLLVESEDTPAPEEILENADDSFIIDDDILDIDDIPDDDLSVRPEAGEEINAEDILIGGGEEEAAEERSAGEAPEEPDAGEAGQAVDVSAIPPDIRNELRSVLSYMDQLLESLPEDKIEEFAKSEQFDTYKKLFEELGLA